MNTKCANRVASRAVVEGKAVLVDTCGDRRTSTGKGTDALYNHFYNQGAQDRPEKTGHEVRVIAVIPEMIGD